MQADIDALKTIYKTVFDNGKMTASQRAQAFVICNRHLKEQNSFAKAFKLSIAAEGYEPVEKVLSYDNRGNPKFTISYYNNKTQTFDLASKEDKSTNTEAFDEVTQPKHNGYTNIK